MGVLILCATWPHCPRSHSEVLVKPALENLSAQFPCPGTLCYAMDTFSSLMKSMDTLSDDGFFKCVIRLHRKSSD